MGTAVPTKKDTPLATASTVADESSVWFWRPREITEKDMQPTSPDRCVNEISQVDKLRVAGVLTGWEL